MAHSDWNMVLGDRVWALWWRYGEWACLKLDLHLDEKGLMMTDHAHTHGDRFHICHTTQLLPRLRALLVPAPVHRRHADLLERNTELLS